MKPTQQEIIELAREHATRYTNRHYPDKPVFTFTQDALQKVIELALERFGAGGGGPVTCDGDFPEGFNASLGIPAQALRTANAIMFDVIGKREWDVPCTAQHLLSFVKRYTHPSPTDLRDEYLRGLGDAAKVCEYVATLYSEAARKHPEDSESRSRTFARSRAASQCVEEIRALLKGKQ